MKIENAIYSDEEHTLIEASINGTATSGIYEGHPTWDKVMVAGPVANFQPIVPTYEELRALAYKPIQEQLDMIFHDNEDGTDTWGDHIRAVKSAYPKP